MGQLHISEAFDHQAIKFAPERVPIVTYTYMHHMCTFSFIRDRRSATLVGHLPLCALLRYAIANTRRCNTCTVTRSIDTERDGELQSCVGLRLGGSAQTHTRQSQRVGPTYPEPNLVSTSDGALSVARLCRAYRHLKQCVTSGNAAAADPHAPAMHLHNLACTKYRSAKVKHLNGFNSLSWLLCPGRPHEAEDVRRYGTAHKTEQT